MHVTLYQIPFSEFLETQLQDLVINPTTEMILSHKDSKLFIICFRSYLTELTTYPNPHTVTHTALVIDSPTSAHINLFPISLHFTHNEAIKFLNTFITLCYTTHPDNKHLISQLYSIRHLITPSGEP